MQTPAEN